MNAESDRNSGVSKWTWVILGAALLMIFGAVWWAAASSAKPEISTVPGPLPLHESQVAAGPGPVSPDPPPSAAFAPDTSAGLGTGPAVSITPVIPDKPNAVSKPKSNTAGIKPITPRDMFPMGDVTRTALPLPQQAQRCDTQGQSGPYRQFDYGGRQWLFTGKYVSAETIDLVPTGYQVYGHDLFALANTGAPDTVLFLQSVLEPDKLAVYRPGG